jgi:hypothetical protein
VFSNKKMSLTNEEAEALICVNMILNPVPQGIMLTKIESEREADFYVKVKGKYILHMKQTSRYVFVKCTGKGLRAADMQIMFIIKDGKIDEKDSTCTVSYNYENYNKMYYDSFTFHEDCDAYRLINNSII